MPDSGPIIQELGFDVKQALADLTAMNRRLKTFNDRLDTLSTTMNGFNAGGAKVGAALDLIAEKADAAEKAIKSLNKAQSQGGGGGAASGAGGGPNGGDSDEIADRLRQRFTLPQGSTLLQQRAFESAIRKTADLAASAEKNVTDVEEIMGGLRRSFDTTDNKIADSIARIERAFQSITNAADKTTQRTTQELSKLAKEANRDEIAKGLRRQFNVPADATVAELRAFENAIEQAAKKAANAGKTVNDIPRLFKNTGKAFTGAENDIVNSLQKVDTAFKKLGNNARREMALLERNSIKNITRITVSFDTFIRIISTQLIIKALNNIQNSFVDAGRAAITFEKSVARIKTLADDELGGLDQISAATRRLSDAFGLGLPTVAEGLYDTISNQIGDAAESLKSLDAAAKFAVATNSELADAVGLSNSIINSFGLEADQSADILGKFFRVIDLGRVNAEDLKSTLGQVGPVANELGVSYEEIGAALAEITVAGVKSSESFTQIRGILNALQKPTKEMRAALEELGFEEAESAIRTLGLAGVLGALGESTNGSANAFAKLFPNMRGFTGATILARNNAEGLVATLAKVNEAGEDVLNEKFQIVFQTNAVKVEREINKLRNALTADLGQSLISATARFFELAGGADTLTRGITASLPILTGAGLALGVIASRAALAQLGLIKMTDEAGKATRAVTLLNRTATFIGLAGLAAGLGKFIGDQIGNAIFDNGKLGLERLRKAQEENDRQRKRDLDNSNAVGEIISDSARRRLQEFTKEGVGDLRAIRAESDKTVGQISKSLDEIVNQRKRLVDELRKAATESADAIIRSQDRVEAIRKRQEERRFGRDQSRRTPEQQNVALARRAEDQAREASKTLGQALKTGSERLLQKALKLFDDAENLADEAASSSASTAGRFDDGTAQRVIDNIVRKRLASEREIQASKERQKSLDEAAITATKEGNKEVQKQVDIIKNNLDFFDDGRPISQSERSERLSEVQKAFGKLQGLGISDQGKDLLNQLGVEDFLNDTESLLAQRPLSLQFKVDTANLSKIDRQLRLHFKGLEDAIPGLDQLEAATGREITTTGDAQSALNDFESQSQQDRTTAKEILDAQARIQSLVKTIENLGALDSVTSAAVARTRGGSSAFDAFTPSNAKDRTAAATAFADFRTELDRTLAAQDFTEERLKSLRQSAIETGAALDKIGPSAQSLIFGVGNLNKKFVTESVQLLDQIVAKQTEIANKSRQLGPESAAGQRFLNQTPLDQQGQQLLQRTLQSEQALKGGEQAVRNGANEALRIRLEAEAAARALIQGANAFSPQLQPLNVAPRSAASNGPSVTNVGDINLTVNNAGQSVNPREIATAVRREIRRGTSKF